MAIGWSCPAVSEEEPHLQLAPIKISRYAGGNVGYVFERSTNGKSKSMQQTLGAGVTAGIGVSSFIMAPWLAQVSSSLSGGVNSTKTSGNTHPTYETVNTSTNGEAALNLVRSSRFPFEARIFRTDNRYAAFYSGINRVMQTTGYALSQDYRSRNERTKAHANFISTKSGGPMLDTSYAKSFSSDLSMQLTRTQSFSLSASSNRANQPGQNQSTSSLLNNLDAAHAYKPNDTFSLASQANLYRSIQEATQGGGKQQLDFSSQQFISFASLRPATTPLTMTSGVRLYKSAYSFNGSSASTLKNSNFNLGANYLFSPLIRLYGSVNVSDSLGTQIVTTDAALTAAKAYRNDTKAVTDIGGFRYSGSIGGSISTQSQSVTHITNQTAASNSFGLGLGLYLTHSLDKRSQWSEGLLATNLNQSVSTRASNSGSSISNLTSRGSLTWNQAAGRGATLIRLSAADTRNLEGAHYLFQMINLQASRKEALSRNRSLQGSLTVQLTHQESGTVTIPNTITPYATLEYDQKRMFNLKDLTFKSTLRIADTNISPGSANTATRSWDNNFEYHIGRLNAALNTQIATINAATQTTLYFVVNRSF